MGQDIFPTTLNTWIGERLRAGDPGRLDINHHIMSVYTLPLQVYCKGMKGAAPGEADDLVAGFFADRLSRSGFLDDWHISGLRLRRWLMNAFCLYVMEQRRRLRRNRSEPLSEIEPVSDVPDMARQMDQAFARSMIREALERTYQECVVEGMDRHWVAFFRHYYADEGYEPIGRELSVDAARAAVMARTVVRKFRRTLREILSRDGATEEDMDREIENLLEISS